MEWCQQCGVVNRPQPAIGVDEDGDPACSTHAVRRNDPEIQTNKTKLDAIRRPASVTQRPAAQPAKESVMERLCKCGCGTEVPASNRFSFIKGHIKRGKRAKAAKPSKVVIKTAAEARHQAPKAEPLCGLVDLGKLKCDLLAKLAAIELIEKTLRG